MGKRAWHTPKAVRHPIKDATRGGEFNILDSCSEGAIPTECS